MYECMYVYILVYMYGYEYNMLASMYECLFAVPPLISGAYRPPISKHPQLATHLLDLISNSYNVLQYTCHHLLLIFAI